MNRSKKALWFPVLLLAWTVVPSSSAKVVISEVMWSGTDLSAADEWFELANTSTGTVNISGWKVTRLSGGSEVEMLTIGSGAIAGSGFFLISNYDRQHSRLGIVPDLVTTAVTLDNTKLLLRLSDASGALVDAVDDGVGAPFAGSNTTPKSSMERVNLTGSGQLASNWRTAATTINWDDGADLFGTPGAPNGTGPSADTIPPEEASNFRAQTDSGTLTLLWTRSTSLDLTNQTLSFSPALTDDSGSLMINSSTNSLQTTHVRNGSGYTVIHRSIDNDGNTSSGVSLFITVRPDVTPPGEVSSLRAVHAASGIVLTWIPPTDDDLDDILVTRIPAILVATLSGSTAENLDGNAGTGSDLYTVQTRDRKGNTSAGTRVRAPPFPNILISEVLSDPSGTETENEWIELHNNTSSGIDLSGFTLDDSGSSRPYAIPQGTTIASGAYLSFRSSETGLGLTNDGEAVALSFHSYTIDWLAFPEAAEDTSYGLLPGSTSSYGKLCTLTEGSTNVNPPPDPLIIIQSGQTSAAGSLTINLKAGVRSGTTAGGVCGWDYRDGFTSGSCNPGSHRFGQVGTYDILLAFTNACGKSGIATLTVVVHEVFSYGSGGKGSASGGGGESKTATCPIEATGGIEISEILPNPKGNDKEGEFIELASTLTTPVRLCGWTLGDDGKGRTPKGLDGFTIDAGAFLVLPYDETKITLNNEGDHVRLGNAVRNPYDDISYATAEEGWSYARTTTGMFAWTPSPTPGEENKFQVLEEASSSAKASEDKKESKDAKETEEISTSEPPNEIQITFSEVMSNPPTGGSLHDLGEYVELFNADDAEIDLAGFAIDDDRRKSSKPWTIPPGITVPPQSHILLPSSITRISLNNEGETLHLYSPAGALLSRIRYPALKRGEAFALFDDASWCVTTSPTPGTENNCILPATEIGPNTSDRRGAPRRAAVMNQRSPVPTVYRNVPRTPTTSPPRKVRPERLRSLRDQVQHFDLPPHLLQTGPEEERTPEGLAAFLLLITSSIAMVMLRRLLSP
jgi:hypothetical protein